MEAVSGRVWRWRRLFSACAFPPSRALAGAQKGGVATPAEGEHLGARGPRCRQGVWREGGFTALVVVMMQNDVA